MTDEAEPANGRGLPTLHMVRAALHVAALLDRRGSAVDDARESYWRHATGGVVSPPDLRMGEQVLIDCGLVVERDAVLYPTADLKHALDGTLDEASAAITLRLLTRQEVLDPTSALPANAPDIAGLVPDAERREELLLALARRWDDAYRGLVGEIGEEIVMSEARRELAVLGHPALARRVRRVSTESAQLGYDVSAPRVGGPTRMLEVKSTSGASTGVATVHISRNEIAVGLRYPDWALVVCSVKDVQTRTGEIIGWCLAASIEGLLPSDGPESRWEVAEVRLSMALLSPGLPRAVH